MNYLDKYWQSLRVNVCTHCEESDGFGNCSLKVQQRCVLQIHFREIITSILHAQTQDLEPSIQKLNDKSCRVCRFQSTDGICVLRARGGNCDRDRFFSLTINKFGKENSGNNYQ